MSQEATLFKLKEKNVSIVGKGLLLIITLSKNALRNTFVKSSPTPPILD